MKWVLGGKFLHMNKQLRGSVYSTSGQKLLTCFCVLNFFCVLQDARFVDLLMAVSVMKVFLRRGNKRCGEVRCLCCTLWISPGRSRLDSECQSQYQADSQPTALPPEDSVSIRCRPKGSFHPNHSITYFPYNRLVTSNHIGLLPERSGHERSTWSPYF